MQLVFPTRVLLQMGSLALHWSKSFAASTMGHWYALAGSGLLKSFHLRTRARRSISCTETFRRHVSGCHWADFAVTPPRWIAPANFSAGSVECRISICAKFCADFKSADMMCQVCPRAPGKIRRRPAVSALLTFAKWDGCCLPPHCLSGPVPGNLEAAHRQDRICGQLVIQWLKKKKKTSMEARSRSRSLTL